MYQLSKNNLILCRIAELFEIIVDFPDSEPALKDLALCLEQVEVKEKLILSLDKRSVVSPACHM